MHSKIAGLLRWHLHLLREAGHSLRRLGSLLRQEDVLLEWHGLLLERLELLLLWLLWLLGGGVVKVRVCYTDRTATATKAAWWTGMLLGLILRGS